MKKKQNLKQHIAYFCAEFGIDSNIPIYAGGLGILAGDYLKEAVNTNLTVSGVGLLYRGKFAIQQIKPDGWQEDIDNIYNPEDVGLSEVIVDGKALEFVVNFTGEDVWISAYKKTIGENVTLYLITTFNDKNSDIWKSVMVADYCCDDENQLRQMMVLGIGGVKLLNLLGIHPTIYHLNEGRPIFLNWELTHQIMHDLDVDFDQAFLLAREKTVYTNHTLLRAGNLSYHPLAIKKYASGYVNALGEKTDELLKPGIEPENGQFSITRFALNISKRASAVSKIHGKLSKKNWSEYEWTTVTNGVNFATWRAPEFENLNLSDREIWDVHLKKKTELREFVLRRTGYSFDENRLVISWARRIADYKRVTSLFTDIQRFAKILKNEKAPVQLLISGKSHYGDDSAKRIIQEVIHFMQKELAGYALYIPDYDIESAQKLVSGSDVWLNTPEFGLEASGTSGMKAIANGVLNATVPDGWANEVDWEGIGWVLDSDKVSESLYQTLEEKAVPLFYKRNEEGYPFEWVEMMKKSLELSEKFSAKRMLSDYINKLYSV